MENSLQYLIALSMVPSIGAMTARKLISYTGSAQAVFHEKKQSLQKIPGIGEILSSRALSGSYLKRAEAEMEFCLKHKIQIISYFDKDFPKRLKQCYDSPLLLYLKGKNLFNEKKVISIVGTRRASSEGIRNIKKLVKEISQNYSSILIVSGLAYGIDYQAHLAALTNNIATAAVLGHGLHTMYPAGHKNMASKIVETGCLLTEFSSDMNPERNNFIRRNRIIAGLSDATIIIESAEKGGALITADIAMSYDRDVFAYPGRCSDEYSKGCNRLIKDNKAAMMENLGDLEYLMNWERGKNTRTARQKILFKEFSQEEKQVLEALKKEKSISRDSLALVLNWPVHKLSYVILNLEFEGLVSVKPGNQYSLNN